MIGDMKMKRIKEIFIGLIMALALLTTSQTLYATDEVCEFLENSSSAKAVSLGNSLAAVNKDLDSISSNPAGLAGLKRTAMQITAYSAFESDTKTVFAAVPLKGFTLGAGYTSTGMTGIYFTDKNSATDRAIEVGSQFSYIGEALLLGIGYELTSEISLGLTGKVMREKLKDSEASGLALDAGVAFNTEDLIYGLTLKNLIKPSNKWNTPSGITEYAEPEVLLGLAINIVKDITFSEGCKIKNKRPVTYQTGIEFKLVEVLPLRFGYEIEADQIKIMGEKLQTLEGLSIGTGLNLDPFSFDISWKSLPADQSSMFRMTLKVSI